MSDNTQLYAGIVIALLIGAAVGWFAKPTPSIDTSRVQELETKVSELEAQIDELMKPPKIGIIMATGGLGDKSFNDIAFSAAQKASDLLGVSFDYVEPTAISEYEGFQRDFAKSGEYMLIVGIGFDQAEGLTIVAEEYPNQNFALVDMVVDKPNVASLTFRANEGSFLLGVVAGMSSETGKIGFIGGMDIPLIRDFFVGYEAGAKWANPDIEVLEPVFVGDWGDPTKAKELTVGLVELGTDSIYSAAGKSGLGALEAADEQGIISYGVDACQDYLNDAMLASFTKRVDTAVYEMIRNALAGKFEGGFKNGGLKENWVGMCRLPDEEAYWEELYDFTHKELPEEIINKVLEAKNKIISGEISVPSGYG